MAFVVPSGKGLFFNAFTEEKAEFWYASRDLPPVRVSDGSWQFYGVEPVYEDSIVGVVSFGSESAVRLTGSQGSLISQFDSSLSWTFILGYDEDFLVMGKKDYSISGDATTLEVYRMYNEAETGK